MENEELLKRINDYESDRKEILELIRQVILSQKMQRKSMDSTHKLAMLAIKHFPIKD
jgi:hypothetical protein